LRNTARELVTLPNMLSFLRIILIPIFIYTYINAETIQDYTFASVIIILSGLTDLLDGWIARTFKQITEIGKTLDPIADKLTQAAIAFCLMVQFENMWILVTLFVFKELFMGINGLILLKRKNKKLDGAMWFGKISTAVFYLTMTLLIAFPNLDNQTANLLIFITGLFLTLSFVLYVPLFYKMYKE